MRFGDKFGSRFTIWHYFRMYFISIYIVRLNSKAQRQRLTFQLEITLINQIIIKTVHQYCSLMILVELINVILKMNFVIMKLFYNNFTTIFINRERKVTRVRLDLQEQILNLLVDQRLKFSQGLMERKEKKENLVSLEYVEIGGSLVKM